MSDLHEVQFTARVKSWIDGICAEQRLVDPAFPFSGADIEDRTATKGQRRDLVIRLAGSGMIALTGEVKLPDRPDGKTPYAEPLVNDALQKAILVGSKCFFTWNVNRFVLWKTFETDTPLMSRDIEFWDWAEIIGSDELTNPDLEARLRRRWEEFLLYYAEIHRGARAFARRPLDERFIHVLESALDYPAIATLTEIHRRYGRVNGFKPKLDAWLIESLGAMISDDAREENLRRAAKFSCYVLANKIVFYDALRRKYSPRLKALSIPKTIRTGEELGRRLGEAFKQAQTVTEDYETVFQGDPFGDALPLINDNGIEAWRGLIEQVDAYDFTRLDYDIIGQIFDRLISPGERHRFGQHYTQSSIVDLINAFCILSPRDKVLDPACGGGTFPIRAYARKCRLADDARLAVSHETLLSDIYGVDISKYAVHLSTISLATRDLVRSANYPRIACSDFFEVRNGRKPFPAGALEGGGGEFIRVGLPETLDAVIGNPPYIRQEAIEAGQKARCRDLCGLEWPGTHLSGRSDMHIYFWLHAARALGPGGRLGFLTSSSWLDVEYGFHLQRWILEHFAIEAIIESAVEPWFTGARVATAATILRREPDPQKRLDQTVRFVQVRRPLGDILTDHERAGDRIEAAERLRDLIADPRKGGETDDWRIRHVRQRDLINATPLDEDKSEVEKEKEAEGAKPTSRRRKQPKGDPKASTQPAPSMHTGGKWGIHLRAPKIFSVLLDRCGEKLVPLGKLAEIRFGLKSGCDAYFFPRDVTEDRKREFNDREFKDHYGITKKESDKIRVCKVIYEGTKSQIGRNVEQIHLIEAQYLRPEIHSVMGMKSRRVDGAELPRRALIVHQKKSALRGTHVFKYIQWGEKQGIHARPSCAGREPQRPWYDLAPREGAQVLWPKAHQYAHLSPWNQDRLIANCRLYELYPAAGVDPLLLSAVLNSSVVALTKFLYGRQVGREGNLDTEVIDARMMLVPDPRAFTASNAKKIARSFTRLLDAPVQSLPEEFHSKARVELDLAIMEAMGVTGEDAREMIAGLYADITALYAETRRLEEIAQQNRSKTARRGKSTPQSVGAEAWDYFLQDAGKELRRFPKDYLPEPGTPGAETFDLPEGRARVREIFGDYSVTIGTARFETGAESRAALLKALAEEGLTGSFAIPLAAADCAGALKAWVRDRTALRDQFESLAIERTADKKQIEQITADLWRRYRRWSQGQ